MLQSKGDDSLPRPRWQWVAFGALAILLAWVPLTYVSQIIMSHVWDSRLRALEHDETDDLFLFAWLAPTATLFLAGVLGGAVLARWGDRCGWREGVVAGALMAALAIGLSWVRFGVSASSVVALGVVMPGAALGALLGGQRRQGGLP